MKSNRSRDSKPELAVRRAAHRLGLRYRVSVRPLPTLRRTADLVFAGPRVAVFVDGCFWHGCPDHHVPSKSNVAWWRDKIDSNRIRDVETDRILQEAGWTVVRVWEHERPEIAARKIYGAVRERGATS